MNDHLIMTDDYSEMRFERKEQVEKFVYEGIFIIEVYHTFPE